MKKITLIMTLLVATLLGASDLEKNVDIEQFKKLPMVQSSNIKIIKAKEIKKGWYYVEGRQNGRKVDLFTDKETLIIGTGYNQKTLKKIKFPLDAEKYKRLASFKYGSGPKEYFLFTDPECPYCRMFDEKMINKYVAKKVTIYGFFYPLNFHLAAKAMSKATLAQSKKDRVIYASKLMHMPLPDVVKEVDKYSSDLYKDLIKAMANPRFANLIGKYSNAINQAYGVNLNSKEEILAYAKKRIAEIKDSKEIDAEFRRALRQTVKDFSVSGTPSLFDAEGEKLNSPLDVFAGIVDMDMVSKIIANDLTVQMGAKGKEKLYIFSSTKCPHCINQFKNKKFIDYLKSKYELHFVLMATGNRNVAQKELMYLYSIEDKKKRVEEFEKIMTGLKVESVLLNKQYPIEYINKMKKYEKMLNDSYVNTTPVIVNQKGDVIRNGNLL